MTRRRVPLLLMVCVAVGASATITTAAEAQILFAMNPAASAAPNHGFDGVWLTPGCTTRTHVPGGGPLGHDAIRFDYIPNPPQGQFYLGWSKGIDPSGVFPLATTKYIRWRLKLTGDLNNNTALTNKHIILEGPHNGDQGVMHRDRFMINWHATSATGFVVRVHMTDNWNISGPEFPLDQWQNVQVMVKVSSALDARDGGYKIWINNDNEAAPNADSWVKHGDAYLGDIHDTSVAGGIPIGGHGMGVHQFGFYANEGLNAGHTRAEWVTDYTVSTTFDPGWSTGGTTQTPPDAGPAGPDGGSGPRDGGADVETPSHPSVPGDPGSTSNASASDASGPSSDGCNAVGTGGSYAGSWLVAASALALLRARRKRRS